MAASVITCPNCGKRNRVRANSDGVPRCAACHSLLPWLVDADTDSFDAELAASVPVLIDFWAPWCGPCKWIAPVIDDLARGHAGELKVVRVNIDEAAAVAERYGVRGIPLLVMTRDAREVDRLAGAARRPELEAWVERHVGAQAPSP